MLRSRTHAALGAALAFLVLLAAGAAVADAAPVTYRYGDASVTLSDARFRPGDRIAVTGAGFEGTGTYGRPAIALKPDDRDDRWGYGGADALTGGYEFMGNAPIWFEPNADGTFAGWVDVPLTVDPEGPGTGPHAGQHWLRVLSGAFSTGDRTTAPITFEAWFDVLAPVEIGYTSASSAFFPGRTFPATGGEITARAGDFDPNETVAVTLDGAPVTATGATTDGAGSFSLRYALPSGTAAGDHVLRFATSSVAVEAPLRVVTHSATLLTPAVRPGGTVAVDMSGYVGIAGTGQKVALNLGGTVLSCVQTSAVGAAVGAGTVPAGTTPGSLPLNVLAGTSCVSAPVVNDPMPRPFAVPGGVTVSATAPVVAAGAESVAAGAALALTGDGFAAGDTMTVRLDRSVAGSVTTTAAGGLAASVTIPVLSTAGPHVLTVTSDAAPTVAAATVVVVTAPSTQPDPDPDPGPDPSGDGEPSGPGPSQDISPPPAPPVAPVAPVVPVAPPAAPKPVTFKGLKASATALSLTIANPSGARATVTVRTRARVRVSAKAKAKLVTLATVKTTRRGGTLRLKLTRDGRAVARRYGKLAVVVRIAVAGRKATSRTVTLRL